MAFLRAIKGFNPGRVCELPEGTILVGRNAKRCDVVLEHFAVSREHARIEQTADGTYIEDLDSRNGVAINGRPISPGASGRRLLRPNDRIGITPFEFVYEEDLRKDEMILLADERVPRPEILRTLDVSSENSRITRSGIPASKLQAVLEILEELAHAMNLNEVLPRILERLFRSFPQAENGSVLLRDFDTGDLQPAAVHRACGGSSPICVSRTVVDQVVHHRSAVLSAEPGNNLESRPKGLARTSGLRSTLCAPLIGNEDRVLGLIQLEATGATDRFAEDDLDVLAGVGRHLAMLIENFRLHDEALRTQRLEFEQQFRRLIEGSLQGILIHRDFKPLFVNQAWAALHGYNTEEVMRLESILPLVAAEDRQQVRDFATTRLAGGEAPSRFEARGLRKDGSTIWLEEFSTVVQWGGEPAIQTSVIDLTDRKRAEEMQRRDQAQLERMVEERTAELAEANRQLQAEIAERRHAEEDLRESMALYHSLVDHIPLCVARKDLEGRFTFVNRSFAELFGMPVEQITGKTDYDLFDQSLAEKYGRDDHQVAQTGERLELFETTEVPDRGTLHIYTLKTPIYDADRKVTGTQLIFSDITSLRKAEEERNCYAQELERSNEELEQFAYSVSHDLQSPLRTVTSYCQLLERRYAGQLDPDAQECLAGAIGGAKRMKRLVEDLLACSRVTTRGDRFGPVDGEQLLREVHHNLNAQIVENAAQITHTQLPTVTGDAIQLVQLLQNLIGNAIRYRREETPRIHVVAEETPEFWKLSVSDNGVGIEPQHYDRIFQFFQRLYAEDEIEGSGIGLSICKRIVQRHGGEIWVESVPGQGSTFYFTIARSMPAGPFSKWQGLDGDA